jgi:hypothetical protein
MSMTGIEDDSNSVQFDDSAYFDRLYVLVH